MSDTQENRLYSISEVAQRTGVSTRTVRYYVVRGLIDPPAGRGRGNHYTDTHIEQIARVRRLQREGVGLDAIGRLGECADSSLRPTEGPSPLADVVFRFPVGPGVRLEFDANAGNPPVQVIDKLVEACRRILDGEYAANNADPRHSGEVSEDPHRGGEDEPR
ncbi:MAG: MerR family transcriptional regulator [Bradymonadales bacterium]|nr:MerR family transcriptional regulator [Bradymonadales bacterium]